MLNNYKLLKLAVTVFKVLAWIGVSLGVISSITIFVGGGTPEAPRWMGLVSLIIGTLYLFIFLVVSEVIKLLLEIKEKIK
jgi:hypothetical protein